MMPAFHSWSAFFAMGGYSFYVWLSLCVTLIALIGLWLSCTWQRKQLLHAIVLQQARQQRVRAAQQPKPPSTGESV